MGVGRVNVPQQALEGATKLHGIGGRQLECLLVESKVAVVGDGAGAAVALGDDPQRGQAEVRMVNEQVGRQQHPVTLLNHAHILLP